MAVLAGCGEQVSQPVSVAAPDLDPAACGAARGAGLIGRDATALERVYILDEVRIIRPGTPVTKDLRPSRLNFAIDANGVIARVFCG